jgi:hypothetical protein
MPDKLSKARRNLLIQMESILGKECYNANIRNYGPGGTRESNGRGFRYPITLRGTDGSQTKVKNTFIPLTATDDMIRSGYYTFGSNQLDVMAGMENILRYLERHHGLVVGGPVRASATQTET